MDITVRRMQREDLGRGFLESLDALKKASDIDPAMAEEIFNKIDSNPDYTIAVADTGKRIVGTATLLVEQKFIHAGGRVGHIEDVAVASDCQETGVGSKIMEFLLEEAARSGCYKTILDCAKDVIPFQKKAGFKEGVNQMRFDHT